MKHIYFYFICLLFTSTTFADSISAQADEQYFYLENKIKVSINSNLSSVQREDAFKELIMRYRNSNDNSYLIIKDGLFRVLASDSDFFLKYIQAILMILQFGWIVLR